MTQNNVEPIPLEESVGTPVETGGKDGRPRMPEPLPVRLVCVEDARLSAAAGLETRLDDFYVRLLRFEREVDRSQLIYRAENFRLIFSVMEKSAKTDMHKLGIEVESLRAAEHQLIEAEFEYARQKGLSPGLETLLLQDPAGNWIELSEARRAV